MSQKPRIPKGTRDFSPTEVAKRNYIFDVIKSNFEKFGFQPIETPSFEMSETLMGKYGEEGDRLIFKILNSGDFLSKVDDTVYNAKDANTLASKISEKALRYDLTVPFARYVVQHQNEIEFPFKRYQIQPVWRADRPQKGRFREFYQCDADVVGSTSLWQEVAFIQLYDAVFNDLGLQDVSIKINNRKILSGIAEIIGAQDKLIAFTVALDKLDKIGEEKVKTEMITNGITATSIKKLEPLFKLSGDFKTQVADLKDMLGTSELGLEGIKELEFIAAAIYELELDACQLQLNVTLARGLNYYTGAILEVDAPEGVQMGSIGGGGRYDDLTGIFGLKGMSGVGISFGLDRIYLVLEELNKFPKTVSKSVKALFLNFGQKEALHCLKAIKALRNKGINTEVYPDAAKVKKQMNYADKRDIPFVILLGDEEIANQQYTLKEMSSGEQVQISLDDLVTRLK
ncbi:MAG: histidine--tRNA ligase [Flavobacteriaceae bacterium]|nr:histidine--tRNA ligase [Flavobacteriaceae bacterium]NNL33351.1 histidine--tRNA ligase [Flavobacteriaceae bacterium]